MRHCTVKQRGFLNWDGLRIAVGRELTRRMVLMFGTGDHLLIFYRHHLVRELTIDRSRSYQRLAEPRRRYRNRDQLQLELQAQPARPRRASAGAGPIRLPAAQGAAEAPESRAAAGRHTVIATTILESGGAAPLHSARRHPTTNQLSPMS